MQALLKEAEEVAQAIPDDLVEKTLTTTLLFKIRGFIAKVRHRHLHSGTSTVLFATLSFSTHMSFWYCLVQCAVRA